MAETIGTLTLALCTAAVVWAGLAAAHAVAYRPWRRPSSMLFALAFAALAGASAAGAFAAVTAATVARVLTAGLAAAGAVAATCASAALASRPVPRSTGLVAAAIVVAGAGATVAVHHPAAVVVAAAILACTLAAGAVIAARALSERAGLTAVVTGLVLTALAAAGLAITSALGVEPGAQAALLLLAVAGGVALGLGALGVGWRRESERLATIAADLERTHDHLLQLAEVDPLTGCANRHALRSWFDRWDEAEPVSLVVVDVDDLKMINDRFGHPAGDDALRLVADVLKESTRPSDLVVRWGGDEFVAVLTGTGEKTAMRRFGSLVDLLTGAADDFPYPIPLEVSWGVASCTERGAIHAALEEADQSMYEMKRRKKAGRR